MKDLLINIITKIMNYTKAFIGKIINNIKFVERKNVIIKEMYISILEKRIKEKDKLLGELRNIKHQGDNLNKEINSIKEENALYKKKINTLNLRHPTRNEKRTAKYG